MKLLLFLLLSLSFVILIRAQLPNEVTQWTVNDGGETKVVWAWVCQFQGWSVGDRPNFCPFSPLANYEGHRDGRSWRLCSCFACSDGLFGEICQFSYPYGDWPCVAPSYFESISGTQLNYCKNGGVRGTSGDRCYCNCPAGYTGATCETSWRDVTLIESGEYDFKCAYSPYILKPFENPCNPDGIISPYGSTSSGTGICRCKCKEGFEGRRCQYQVSSSNGMIVKDWSRTDGQVLAGICINGGTFLSGGWCSCKSGWTGAICQRRWNDYTPGYEYLATSPTGTQWICAYSPYDIVYPNHCDPTGHQGVVYDAANKKCTCSCYSGRTGALCTSVTCINPPSITTPCSGHGICTSNGCSCTTNNENAWIGGYCSTRSPCSIVGTSKAVCSNPFYYGINENCIGGLSCECKSNTLYSSPYCCPISQVNQKTCHGNKCIQTDRGSICECIKTPKGSCNGFNCKDDGTCDCFNGRPTSCRISNGLASDGLKAYVDCSVDNTFGDFPSSIRNIPLWYGESCCPTAYHLDNPKRRSICGGRGTCSTLTGTCNCLSGLGGEYCCPTSGGLSCGGHGTCNEHGLCDCSGTYSNGILRACEVNTICPSTTTSEECSGRGTCQAFIDGNWPEIINDLNWDKRPPFNVPVAARNIATQGIYEYIRWLFYVFLNQDVATLSENYWLASHIDGHALTRVADQSQITIMRSPTATPESNRALAQAMFRRAFPSRTAGDIVWLNQFLMDITSTDRNRRVFAMESLLTYEIFLSYPTVGYRCRCGSPGATGLNCASNCPVGLDNKVCSGFFNGRSRGLCDLDTEQCVCSNGWIGTACTLNVVGMCMNNSDTDSVLCSDHGTCTGNDTFRQCQCESGWFGKYCQYSSCAKDLFSTLECSNSGECNGVTKQCTCNKQAALSSSQSSTVIPQLPIGVLCNETAQLECIAYRPTSSSGLNFAWMECNGHGTCTSRSHLGLAPTCVCDSLYSGSQCTTTSCGTKCNIRQTCNSQGQCVCKPMYMPPSSCADDSTLPSLCDHGIPDANGTSCICDDGFKKNSQGYCSIPVCPLVIDTNQGIVPCDSSLYPNCPNLSVGGSNCCYDACGSSCRYNGTNFRCNCANTIAFEESNGICYPKCHGKNNYHIIGQNTLRCDCSSIVKTQNQYVDTTCQLFTCLNGGIGVSATLTTPGSCTCIPPYHGSFCGNVGCGSSGSFNETSQKCDCVFPFVHSSSSDPFCSSSQCVHGTPIPGQCQCDLGWSETLCDKQIFISSSSSDIYSSSSSSSSLTYTSQTLILSSSSSSFSSSVSPFVSSSTGMYSNSSSGTYGSSTAYSSSSSATAAAHHRLELLSTFVCFVVMMVWAAVVIAATAS